MSIYFSRRRFLLSVVKGIAVLRLSGSPAAFGGAADSASYDAALRTITGGRKPEETGLLALDVPDSAENGAIVPVALDSRLERTTALHLLVVRNPRPLAASFEFLDGALASVSFRIKMNESSPVVALAEAGGRIYWSRKQVKVAVGGCG
ncbi:MAG: thiosulfate oxidation carrier protein SoxY [Methylococcus sp.]|nr:thiosulfate oxidation carrier protein SoxY [Methylococcus sp.]